MNLIPLTGLLGGPPNSSELGGTGKRIQRKERYGLLKDLADVVPVI